MKIDIVTIFPTMVLAPLAEGIVARAIAHGVLDVRVHDLRDFTTDRHRVVDDMPFGGGPGMVLKPEPLFAAVDRIRDERCERRSLPARRSILTSPDGERLTHAVAERLSALEHLVVLCGRYEGVDERVREHLATDADLDRRLRVVGRRAAGAGDRRRGGAADSRRGGRRSVGGGRHVRARRAAGLSAVHAPGRVPGPRGAAGAAVGAPRGDREMAAAAGARAHAPSPSGFVGYEG